MGSIRPTTITQIGYSFDEVKPIFLITVGCKKFVGDRDKVLDFLKSYLTYSGSLEDFYYARKKLLEEQQKANIEKEAVKVTLRNKNNLFCPRRSALLKKKIFGKQEDVV